MNELRLSGHHTTFRNTDEIFVYVLDWHSGNSSEFHHDTDSTEETEDGTEDSSEPDIDKDTFLIKAFGLDSKGYSYCINIEGFIPYFYIKVPDTWKSLQASLFVENLKKRAFRRMRESLISYKLVRAKPLYMFTAKDRFLYLKLSFRNHKTFMHYEKILKKELKINGLNRGQPMLYQLHESNIHPLIRFLHVQDLSPAYWVKIPANKYKIETHGKISRCNREITINYRAIMSADMDEVPKIVVGAYDIEADSSHGDFPIAKK